MIDAPYRELYEIIVEQPGGHVPQVALIATAFAFTLKLARAEVPNGESFVPSAVGTAEDTLSLWAEVAERCSSPRVRARLHHLLFDAGYDTPHVHARKAATSYFDCALPPLPLGDEHLDMRLAHASAAEWSHELARRMGYKSVREQAENAIAHVTKESLASCDHEAGIVVPLLERLVMYCPTQPELEELLERAMDVYVSDRWNLPRIIQLQRRLLKNDPERDMELRRAEVEVILARAEENRGIARQSHFEIAARRAAELGISDLRERAIRELQSIEFEELGLVPMMKEIHVSREYLERRADHIATSTSVAEMLSRVVESPPPSGDWEENRRGVEADLSGQALLSAAATSILGEGGLPTFEARTEEEQLDAHLSMRECELMMIFSLPVVDGLRRALASLLPSVDDITAVLEAAPGVPTSSARSIARAIDAFGAGRCEEAASLALMRVETQVRLLCEHRGKLLYEIEQGKRRGQFPALGSLLSALEGELDVSWWRFLNTFLVGAAGANYRNRLFHGYVRDVDDRHAALAIVCALYVARAPNNVLLPAGETGDA